MDVGDAGLTNLSEFVAATAGRRGEVGRIPGGVLVASPFPMQHGFVTAGFRTDPSVGAAEFLDAAIDWFDARRRAWSLWIPEDDTDLAQAARGRGGTLSDSASPAMVIRTPVPDPEGFTVHHATGDELGPLFGELAEAGYEMPGMGWLMGEHDSFTVPDASWALVTSTSEPELGPISVAAGYLHGATGGVYYVATPPQFRRRGAAAAVTAVVTNELFARGATTVTLQATDAGFPVYERMGYETYGGFRSCPFGEDAVS